jgi:Uma2 family endonuclease
MAALSNDARLLSEDEYLKLDQESNIKHEYFDGFVIDTVGASEEHNNLATTLTFLLYGQLRGGSCRVYSSDMRVHIAATGNYVYPDITVVCGEPRFVEESSIATLLNPTMIVEVLSPSTEVYDRGKVSELPHAGQPSGLRIDQPGAAVGRVVHSCRGW